MMEKEVEPFEFKQCVTVVKSTGKRAKNLRELGQLLRRVSDESIIHHTCQYFLHGHVFEQTNGFAQWVAESLGEKALSEHLSNIDPFDCQSIEELRHELLKAIDSRLRVPPRPRDAMGGNEFFFSEAITLVFPTHVRAASLAEFLIGIQYVDKSSIYYHFYEARIRLRGEADDFSKWFASLPGNEGLAEKIRSLDPFMDTLEGVRKHIIETVEDEMKKTMERISA
jgi:hypothetical protein